MIRINLLPVKAHRKAEAGRQQLILFALVLVAAIGGNLYVWQQKSATEADKQAQVAKTQQQIAELDKVIAEVKDINKKEDELKTKLGALNKLKAGRAGPVKVLDALQTAMPKKVWLSAVTEAGGAMKIDGVALSQDDLAEFMTALQNVVDTPQGIGRLVAGDNAKESRVELSTDGKVVNLVPSQVTPFFTSVKLGQDQQGSDVAGAKTVKFSLSLAANYSA
ncbi:MAG: PilN domain-containing protein [Deltaproteobacteria bacterium]|nr:PilN domain-containing protein [Deltaproteobacteria bacterium]